MENRITIWTLNRAAELLDKNQQAIIDIFKKAGYDAVFGDRTMFNAEQDPDKEPVINLMPGIEYFVPIVPKCIGGLFEGTDNDMLKNIRNYYEKEAGQLEYTGFWEAGNRDYKMLTHACTGYYSILRKTAPNFLVGYSQGGLVTRYLLWLAENVFNEPDLVKGAVTISSPNFGSPLANPDNEKSILSGFIEIILIIFQHKSNTSEMAHGIVHRIELDVLLKVLDLVSKRLQLPEHTGVLKAEKQEKTKVVSGILQSIYDWLGGLRDDPNNAFYDLNIFRLNYPYSVLSSVKESSPVKTIRGIISADNNLTVILWDVIIKIIWGVLKECLDIPKVFKGLIDPEHVEKMLEQGNLLHKGSEKVKEIEKVINETIMMEHPSHTVVNKIIQERIKEYTTGESGNNIPAYAHDFVIPSVYQLTTENDGLTEPPGFNHVNSEANHLSGSSLFYQAGRKNVQLLEAILPELLG